MSAADGRWQLDAERRRHHCRTGAALRMRYSRTGASPGFAVVDNDRILTGTRSAEPELD